MFNRIGDKEVVGVGKRVCTPLLVCPLFALWYTQFITPGAIEASQCHVGVSIGVWTLLALVVQYLASYHIVVAPPISVLFNKWHCQEPIKGGLFIDCLLAIC